ncbi:hypothetical protein FOG18_10440 [Legionella israelensis]|uniref:hypothetical protein n=1 Tax=Legionella israelensis TaxID=454 RepID=UPI00117C6FAA|nr:hypothetical protein [Legionella israelensis]QDP72950.1 hypothetical protein FOG18_10440 [Legionella israelensis]
MKYIVKKNTIHEAAEYYFGFGSKRNPKTWLRAMFCFFMGSTVSKQVLPAQNLKNDFFFLEETYAIEAAIKNELSKASDISFQHHEIENFDGALLETAEFLHIEQQRQPIDQQKFVIFAVGNDMCMQDLYKDLVRHSRKLKQNVVAFNFRNVIRSSGALKSQIDLVYDAIAQVERLRNMGVSEKNISLVGHSLGAAVLTLISYLYFKQGMPIKIFNGRSFSSFSNLKHYQLERERETKKQKWTSLKLYLSNFELEVAPYFIEIPDKYKEYIVIKPSKHSKDSNEVLDGVIPEKASLHYSLKKEKRSVERVNHWKNRKVISSNRLFGFGHNDPLSLLKCRDSEETAEEFCHHFIKR